MPIFAPARTKQSSSQATQPPLDTPKDTEYHSRELQEWMSGPTPATLEENYRALGNIRLDVDKRKEVLSFWRGLGSKGAEWLLQRIHSETDVETLSGVGSALSRMGDSVLPLILRSLAGKDGKLSAEMAETLIIVLMRFKVPQDFPLSTIVPTLLTNYFTSRDVGLRQTAYTAAARLAPEYAKARLQQLQEYETDSDARELISELLEELAEA